MKKKDEDPPVWITLIKLIVIAAVLIGGVGFGLSWVNDIQSKEPSPAIKPSDPWGIARDSPIRFRQ
jgi:hypothetical protein